MRIRIDLHAKPPPEEPWEYEEFGGIRCDRPGSYLLLEPFHSTAGLRPNRPPQPESECLILIENALGQLHIEGSVYLGRCRVADFTAIVNRPKESEQATITGVEDEALAAARAKVVKAVRWYRQALAARDAGER